MTKDELQEILDAQAELYAGMLGEVEDRLKADMAAMHKDIKKEFEMLTAEIEIAFATQTAAMVDTFYMEKMKEEICRRVYNGVRYQAKVIRGIEPRKREKK